MTLLEYTKTLEVLGITKISDWNNLEIKYSNTYYAIILGEIPLDVANTIYEKYPNNPYAIRVKGGCEEWNPSEWSKKGYLETYHIDTKEGVIIFIAEMLDYLSRKNKQEETEVNKFDEILKEVNRRVLDAAKPSINGYQWMMKNEENKDLYLETLEKMKQDEFQTSLRALIEKFDIAVNPFNNTVTKEEKERLLDEVNVTGIFTLKKLFMKKELLKTVLKYIIKI